MWRAFCLLSLTLFTFDFPRNVAKSERVPGYADLVKQYDDDPNRFRAEVRSQSEDIRRENAGEVVGKWRNNGEALEPKWRDGDTVPSLPFSQYTRYTKEEIENSDEEEDNYNYRGPSYQPPKNGRENSLRSRNTPRLSYKSYEDYESIESSRRGYRDREREDISPRKRNRPWISENAATLKETGGGSRKEQQTEEVKGDGGVPATRYREAFQVHQNEYEHEFSDDEYLKPRPRKRRPPQNYEFALAENETAYNNSGTWFRAAENQENASESATTNAMELKSLLKMQQEEGLSLSEILQQRNLTLNDLLNGKADVINALKMKDVDKTEDYIVETRVTSNSFAKLSASTTNKPEWTVSEFIEPKSSWDKEFMISIGTTVLRNDPTRGSIGTTSRDEPRLETANATIGKSILLGVDSTYVDPRGKVAVTTQMPLPIATNAMELLQVDDATVKSRDGGETKVDSLDEDEIMEFSDFTDYNKKGRSGMSPVWLMMKDGKPPLRDAKIRFEDGGSTLSIERITSPTERSKPMNNLSNPENEGHSIDKTKMLKDQDQLVNAKYSTEGDYNTPSEKEYQNDAPMYYDLEYSTQISGSTDENDMRNIMAQEPALDAMSREENITVENNQPVTKPLFVVNESDDNLKNHKSNLSEKKSYDEIISEVEPEARAEIFELFASGSAGKRLERLLKSRNMSLEELIALRQRGSSKVHLAEVSRIRTQKVTTASPRKEMIGEGVIKHEDNFNKGVGNYLPQSPENGNSDLTNPVRTAESTTEEFLPSLESIFNNENTERIIDSVTKTDENKGIEEGHRTDQIVDLLTTFGSMPFMKNIKKDLVGQYNSEDEKMQNSNIGVVYMDKKVETIRVNDTSNLMESGFVKEVVKEAPNSIDIQTLYSETTNDILSGENDEKRNKKGKIFSKPSIIASGAILGVTLVVFLGIFIICRIRQKQKYRYRNTFSRAVFQGPVLTPRKLSNSSSLSTVMVNVVATSTAKRPEKNEAQESAKEVDSRTDIDNDSLDANDSWETIPDYMK